MRYIEKLKERARVLRQEILAVSLALKDKRTPLIAKIIIGLTISYAVSPIDLIPDFIPVLGYLDDLIILPLMITLAIRLIPEQVMRDCRSQVNDNLKIGKIVGLPAAIVIVILWVGLLGTLVYKIIE